MKQHRQSLDPKRLENFIKDLGLAYKSRSKSYVMQCPLCGKKDKLYIRKNDGRFACWVCRLDRGFQGAPEFALAELSGMKLQKVREILYGSQYINPTTEIHLSLSDFFDEQDSDDEVVEDVPDLTWPHHCLPLDHQFSIKGAEYLAKRGIPHEIAKQYDIRYSPEQRAIGFPVWIGQRLVGWQYRTVLPLEATSETGTVFKRTKVWSSNDIPRDRVVMFQNRLSDCNHAIVCEGPIDALKAHLCGGNVATMGKAVSKPQMAMLARSGITRMYLALDPDASTETGQLVDQISDLECYLMVAPKPYKDLGEMSFEEVYELYKKAQPAKKGLIYVFLAPPRL